MEITTIHLHTRFQVGPVDPRIFGGFLEHMGRAVYEGVYDPQSRHADPDGFRSDVLAALRRLDMTAMRYPGGNFASGYRWLDGIGPRDRRPTVRELAWQSREPNRFGTDEYIRLCRIMGWTPMITVNLGTGTPEEARNWVEYCNCPPGTRYADLRAAGGHPEPHGIKLWCLGNEMDGPWQLGHVPADQYAIRAQQAAKMMKDVDRTIELVACGSCTTGLPTYMEWDRQVLEHISDLADYVSLHRYVGNRDHDTADYLAVTNSIDRQIEEMDAACRFVQARRRRVKRTYLCFDEWNVWYKNHQTDGEGQFAPHLIEEVYNLEDALVAAGFLNSFIRHADVVKIANIAQIVNVIAPLLTRGDELLIQSIFYAFEMFSRRRNGISLRPIVDGPTYEGKTQGRAAFVDASAILDAGRLHVFATNRSLDAAAPLCVTLADRTIAGLESAEILTGSDPKAANSFEQPDVIRSEPFAGVRVKDGAAELALPPLSVAALTFRLF
ncbi:MAG: alpha-N-arabinofuranosidase [Chloroflexi bacterium]|nr:alpha-N-arabinofuranosidase [Chloroflexota bacterium]